MPNLAKDLLNWFIRKLINGAVKGGNHIARPDDRQQKDLGLEAIDLEQFNEAVRKNERHERITGFFSGASTSTPVPPRPNFDQEGRIRISDKESAIRLVRGIALHNDVVLFTKQGLAEDQKAPSRLIYDVMTALCPEIKVVDVSGDSDMHMGLAQEDGEAILPCLYIGGKFIGDQAAVLEALQNGNLEKELQRARVSYDSHAMKLLTSQPSGNQNG